MKPFFKRMSAMLLVAFILTSVFVGSVSANGMRVVTSKTDKGYTITLTSQEANKGIKIVAYSIKNAGSNSVKITYALASNAPKSASVTINANEIIAPFRVYTANTDKLSYRPFSDIYGIEADEYITHLHDVGITNGNPDGSFKPNNTITRGEVAVMMCAALKLNIPESNLTTYSDTKNHWAKKYISAVAKNGVMSANKGKFRPNDKITTAEVCAMINKALKFNTKSNGVFTKLAKNKWYTNDVQRIFDLKILTPQDSIYNSFKEEVNISRANFSIMLSRALSTY